MTSSEKITLFDNRVTEATAKKLPDGKYEVTMKVHAGKVYVDGTGKETDASSDIPIDIGVFAGAADGKEQDERCCTWKSGWSPTATARSR